MEQLEGRVAFISGDASDDTARITAGAIRANRFPIFTNREFLKEVKEHRREIADAFPLDEPTPGRIRLEAMRREIKKNLLALGIRPLPARTDDRTALNPGSKSPAGGQ